MTIFDALEQAKPGDLITNFHWATDEHIAMKEWSNEFGIELYEQFCDIPFRDLLECEWIIRPHEALEILAQDTRSYE